MGIRGVLCGVHFVFSRSAWYALFSLMWWIQGVTPASLTGLGLLRTIAYKFFKKPDHLFFRIFHTEFFHIGSVVKNLPINARDIGYESSILGWEDPLEKEMATHSSILTWRIPGTKEPGGASRRLHMTLQLNNKSNIFLTVLGTF